jgi:patatin-like phospholipase/acyl hydrolase
LDLRAPPKRGPRPFTERRVNSRKTRRDKLPWPAERPFRILSLDGGGIRGIYGATLLRLIEEKITGGVPVADYFDTLAGTSTGGIMAIALGLKKPATLIERLYSEDGSKVFPEYWTERRWRRWMRRLKRSLYDNAVLERLLYKIFGDQILGDSYARLVIPSFLGPETQVAVLKTDHHPDFQNDWKMAAWEAARATSAAPTFLPGHGGDGYVFLDGGVWANNPIMAAVIDALSSYDVSRDQIEVLSIGTGNAPHDISAFALKGGMFDWREIINGAVFLTTDNAQAQATLLLGPEKILRLEPLGDAAKIELDDFKPAKAQLPPLAAQEFEVNKAGIAQFFRSKVEPRHRYYTTA